MDLANNKRALHEYKILESFEAGLVLLGQEVKSAKAGQVSLKGSYVSVKGNEVYLINANISRYKKAASSIAYDPMRPRKLLLRKPEIRRIAGILSQSGLTLIPISLYTKGQLVKISVGVAQSKNKFDKRQSMKKREADREIQRRLKDR
jgi:SsrA-binding protein